MFLIYLGSFTNLLRYLKHNIWHLDFTKSNNESKKLNLNPEPVSLDPEPATLDAEPLSLDPKKTSLDYGFLMFITY